MINISLWILFAAWAAIVIIKRIVVKKGNGELFLVTALAVFYGMHKFALVALLNEAVFEIIAIVGLCATLLIFPTQSLFTTKKEVVRTHTLKQELKNMKLAYESLRQRFIALIDLSKEGLLFYSDDGHVFVTDAIKDILKLDSNEISNETFLAHIHSDDQSTYQDAFEKKIRKQTEYSVRYRFKAQTQYVWLSERGKRVFYENRSMVIAKVVPIEIKQYPETETELLNTMPKEHVFLDAVQTMSRLRKTYHIVFFELANIPAINEQYGRDIGDLMMGEFINKIRYQFLKEKNVMYRLSGIRFALIIKEKRKYDMLERALKSGGELLQFDMRFGHAHEQVYPYFGIHEVVAFDEPVDALIERTHKALNIALKDTTQENYFIIE